MLTKTLSLELAMTLLCYQTLANVLKPHAKALYVRPTMVV